jgi:hypothetical protein
VTAIADSQSAVRDNEDLIGGGRSVPISRTAIGSRHNPILGSSLTTKRSKIAAKLLVLKDFSCKSFKLKDFARIFAQLHDSKKSGLYFFLRNTGLVP